MPSGAGFGADDGASLLMAFRGLQEESATQGKVHKAIANELETLVADPFADWARGYRVRIMVYSPSPPSLSPRTASIRTRGPSWITGCAPTSMHKARRTSSSTSISRRRAKPTRPRMSAYAILSSLPF